MKSKFTETPASSGTNYGYIQTSTDPPSMTKESEGGLVKHEVMDMTFHPGQRDGE